MAGKRKSEEQQFHEPDMEKHRKQLVSENINRNNWTPEEMQFCILQYLPGKSLKRFKCVSKSWNFMISDPNLIRKSHKIILCDFKSIFLMNYEVSCAKATKLDLPTKTRPKEVSVRASCNGILWISVNHEENILWNPFTSERKILPTEPLSSQPQITRMCAYGFGYDHTTNDYKIIYIPEPRLKPFIYSVTKNSCESLDPHYSSMSYLDILGVSMKNGSVVYWPVMYFCLKVFRNQDCAFCHNYIQGRSRELHPAILGFDVVNRRQVLVPQATGLDYDEGTVWKLMDFKGSICMMKNDQMEEIIEIWLFKEEMGKENYWVNLMSVDLVGFGLVVKPIYIARDEEVLMSKTGLFLHKIGLYLPNDKKRKLYTYNSTEKGFRSVEVHEVNHWYQEVTYSETLASIQS